MSNATTFDWTTEKTVQLTELIEGGFSFAEAGRIMGVSKNAIAGKANRLGLASKHPQPRSKTMTEEEKIAKPKPVRRLPMTGPTLPPLSVTAQPQNMPGMRFCTLKLKDEPLPVAFRRRSAGVSDLPCSWPLGEPGKPGFRFCDEPVMPGRQYCGPHCERAYVRPERIKVVARDVSA